MAKGILSFSCQSLCPFVLAKEFNVFVVDIMMITKYGIEIF